MEQEKILTYEGGFQGYLSAVSMGLSQGLEIAGILPGDLFMEDTLFGVRLHVPTEITEARRLWNALGTMGPETQRYIYYSYLSDKADIQFALYGYIQLLFRKEDCFWKQKYALREQLSPWAQRVGKEKRHFENTMRFRYGRDGLPYCAIRPVFNVLPLLSKYCRMRFPEGPWLVYDSNRNVKLYGEAGQITLSQIRHNDTGRILGAGAAGTTGPLPERVPGRDPGNAPGALVQAGRKQRATCGARA